MYAWFFNHVLPGPLWVRIILALLLVAGIVFLLMEFAFPRLSQYSPFNDSTLEGA